MCKSFVGNAASIGFPRRWAVRGGLLHGGSAQQPEVSSRQVPRPSRERAPCVHTGHLPPGTVSPGVEWSRLVELAAVRECSRSVLSNTVATSHV